MSILKKILAIFFFFWSFTSAVGALGMLVGTTDHPEPQWGTAIFSVLIAWGMFVLGRKFWPKAEEDLTTSAPPVTPRTTTNPAPEPSPARSTKPRREELSGREVRELYDLAQRILMDMKVSHREAEDLLDWLEDHPASHSDYRTCLLFKTLNRALEDGHFDEYEAEDVCYWLGDFCDDVDDEIETFGLHHHQNEVGIDGLVSGGKYLMVYTDAQGARSERTIKFIRQTFSNGNAYIQAVCLTKNANRTFRVDRIESLFSMDSGEVLV